MNKSVPPTKNFLLSGGNWIACTPPPLHNAAYMNIRILSDGKQGHLNQSLGLAQALISKAGGTVETVNLQGLSLLGKSGRSSQAATFHGRICSFPLDMQRISRSSARGTISKPGPSSA